MATESDSNTNRFRYLLGLSSQIERERIEADYLDDEDTFQKMLAAEDDLIDSYARGELTTEEQWRFENYYLRSAREGTRIKFARAFAGAVSDAGPLESTTPPALLFSSFQVSAHVLRIAGLSVAVLAAVVLSWLVLDRMRMSNELRDLRAQSAELRKQSEELQRAQCDQQKQREDSATRTNRENKLASPKIAINSRGTTYLAPRNEMKPTHTSVTNTQDATLGASFDRERITELPLNAKNVANLLTLQPTVTRTGTVSGGRADQANATLNGVGVTEASIPGSEFEDPLTLRVGIPGLVSLPRPPSNGWIRMRLILESAAQHTDYRATVQAADGHPVFSVDWIEPVTPDQTAIDTPIIPTTDLPLGNYRLLLLGKEPAGSFVKVADYSFRVLGSLSPGP